MRIEVTEGEDRNFILRWAKKYRAVQLLGGKCNECGNDDIFVLEFHHKDPSIKEFCIDIRKASAPWDVIEKEVKKCMLLCRNCHRIFHNKKSIDRFHKLYALILSKSKVVHKISRPPLDEERIYKMLKQKYTIMGIGQVFKRDPSTILEVANRLERKTGEKLFIRRDEYNTSKKKIDFEKLVQMYNEGKTIKEICNFFNSAYSTVAGRLTKLRKKGIKLDRKEHNKKVHSFLTKPWNRDNLFSS
jgi:hypothetical protein